jgi:hypothetical protein
MNFDRLSFLFLHKKYWLAICHLYSILLFMHLHQLFFFFLSFIHIQGTKSNLIILKISYFRLTFLVSPTPWIKYYLIFLNMSDTAPADMKFRLNFNWTWNYSVKFKYIFSLDVYWGLSNTNWGAYSFSSSNFYLVLLIIHNSGIFLWNQ